MRLAFDVIFLALAWALIIKHAPVSYANEIVHDASQWNEYPLGVRCDLAVYFHRKPMWLDPTKPYHGFPVMPPGLLRVCPECRWDVVPDLTMGVDPVCNALVEGAPYSIDTTGNAREKGECRFYPRMHPPGETLHEHMDMVIRGQAVDKFLPYFYLCSENQEGFVNNRIAYDFTSTSALDPVATVSASILRTSHVNTFTSASTTTIDAESHVGDGGIGVNSVVGASVLFIDNSADAAGMQCTEIPDLRPETIKLAVSRNIERTVRAINSTTGAPLDVGIIDMRILHRENPTGHRTCNHANYMVAAEMGAYEYTEPGDIPADASDQPIARGYWARRVVQDTHAPRIKGIPAQPSQLPHQVECSERAVYWSMIAAPSVFNPKIEAIDECAGTVPVRYRVVWTGLPGEVIACPDRATVTLEWSADDGCGNEGKATQMIRVYDDAAPFVPGAPDDGFIRVCLARDEMETLVPTRAAHRYWQDAAKDPTWSARRVCIEHTMKEYMGRAARDNCSPLGLPVDYVEFEWSETEVEQCTPSKALSRDGQLQTLSGCVVSGGKSAAQAVTRNPTGCFAASDGRSLLSDWTRIRTPILLRDRCGNVNARHTLDVLLAPTARMCKAYGFEHVAYIHKEPVV